MRTVTRRGARRLAVSTVEFAFVAPVFFLLLFGITTVPERLFRWLRQRRAARQ